MLNGKKKEANKYHVIFTYPNLGHNIKEFYCYIISFFTKSTSLMHKQKRYLVATLQPQP